MAYCADAPVLQVNIEPAKHLTQPDVPPVASLQRGHPHTGNIHPSHLDHMIGGIIDQ